MRQDKQEAGNRRVEELAQCNDWGWHEASVKQCFEVDGMEDRFAASGFGLRLQGPWVRLRVDGEEHGDNLDPNGRVRAPLSEMNAGQEVVETKAVGRPL